MPRRLAIAIAVIAAVAIAAVPALRRATRVDGPNVVFVVLDTTRADHLGCYGYERDTTPEIDAFAAGGVTFSQAVTPIPETLPSVCSIMTSAYPIDHEVRANGGVLREQWTTLAELLASRGYETAAFVSSGVLHSKYGIDQGFETFNERLPDPLLAVPHAQRTADETMRAALSWLARAGEGRRPVFLWVHCIDPHGMYTPPPPYDEEFRDEPYHGRVIWDPDQFIEIIRNEVSLGPDDAEYMIDRYDGEIAFADHNLGDLFEAAGALKRKTLVIVTADHGEALGEHDYHFDHGDYVYDDQIRVPLVVRFPDLPAGGTVDEQVETIDILPTVAELLGLAPDDRWRGRSLVPLMRGGADDEPARPALCESDRCSRHSVRGCRKRGVGGKLYGLRIGRFKYILNPDGADELYDLEKDPLELDNSIQAKPELADRLAAELRTLIAGRSNVEGDRELSEESIRMLRSLGYTD